MAVIFERTRRGREKVDRLEVRRVSGRPGDRGEVVARIPLESPLRIPRRVREVLAAARSERVGETSQTAA